MSAVPGFDGRTRVLVIAALCLSIIFVGAAVFA